MQNQLTGGENLQQSSSSLQQNSSNLQQSRTPSGITDTTQLPNQLPPTSQLGVQSTQTDPSLSQTYLPDSTFDPSFVLIIIAAAIVSALASVVYGLSRTAAAESIETAAPLPNEPAPVASQSVSKPKKQKGAKKPTRRQRTKR